MLVVLMTAKRNDAPSVTIVGVLKPSDVGLDRVDLSTLDM
jgi:hypothetical protein